VGKPERMINETGVFMTTKKRPPIHPCEILKDEFLEPMEISQQQLAEDISVSTQHLNEIVQGKQAITAEMALRLGRYFGMSTKCLVEFARTLCSRCC